MPKPFIVYLLSTARSPVTHMAGTSGNRGIVAREEVVTEFGKRAVPFLSGNALRHSLLREPGIEWLLRESGLENAGLTKPEAYFLIGGGAGYVGGAESTTVITELATVCPLIGLLGGTLPKQILSGSVNVDRGVLVCEENRARLGTFLPPSLDLSGLALRPADSFVGSWQYTRMHQRDAVADVYDPDADLAEREWEFSAAEKPPASAKDMPLPGEHADKSQQMIFGGECVLPGAAFAHRIVLMHPEPLEIGAVLFSLRLWRERGGAVGGMAARGHGLLDSLIWHEDADGDPESDYVAHMGQHMDKFADWLKRQFRGPKDKPADGDKPKGRKKKEAATP